MEQPQRGRCVAPGQQSTRWRAGDRGATRKIAGAILAVSQSLHAGAAAAATPEEAARAPEATLQSDSPGPAAPAGSKFKDPGDGQFDVSQVLEKPHGFLPVPLVVTEPAVGYGGGVAGMFLRPRRDAGAEGWARPNISALGGLGTQNGTWLAFAADSSRWVGGRLSTLLAGGTGKANLDFYGAGLGLPQPDQPYRYSLKFSGGVAQADWQLMPRSPWSAGLRYVYAEITPELRDPAEFPVPPVQRGVTVSAPTAILEYDSRNNIFTPTRGVYAETSYLVSRRGLGSSVDFERFEQILLGWLPLPHDVTLGGWANYAWASAGAPFFLRPYVQLRGVPAMRYQGDQVASLEVEARWQCSGRWSLVPFAGVGATRLDRSLTPTSGQRVGSGGLGIRYELARKFGLHAGLDFAHSAGTNAVYLQIGNAWFRP
ncbi:MAG: hypothetical protein JSR36_13095 [Proteobacteria bacterium]|nr:hypothetical protein [Pseudomonadota bacterium]